MSIDGKENNKHYYLKPKPHNMQTSNVAVSVVAWMEQKHYLIVNN